MATTCREKHGAIIDQDKYSFVLEETLLSLNQAFTKKLGMDTFNTRGIYNTEKRISIP